MTWDGTLCHSKSLGPFHVGFIPYMPLCRSTLWSRARHLQLHFNFILSLRRIEDKRDCHLKKRVQTESRSMMLHQVFGKRQGHKPDVSRCVRILGKQPRLKPLHTAVLQIKKYEPKCVLQRGQKTTYKNYVLDSIKISTFRYCNTDHKL